jgi:integrase/recombinase XerD
MRISDGVEQYVTFKHENGYIFRSGQVMLAAFSRHIGEAQLKQIKTYQVLTFLDQPTTSVTTWRLKHQALCRFFNYWSARGAMPELLMPPQKPFQRKTPFVPYIFTRLQLRCLFKAARYNQRLLRDPKSHRSAEYQTLRMLVLLLYGTGARIGELLQLTLGDVDLKKRKITIRKGAFDRTRQIPIGADLYDHLRKYLTWRSRRNYLSQHLFVTIRDQPITVAIANKHWQTLRRTAGLTRNDGSRYQPRINDLRLTFAVHRITSWIRNGADLNRMLPALAAYMGQTGLGATGRYLAMTPERFRKQLNKLSPSRGKGRWRDDKVLMEFLASL